MKSLWKGSKWATTAAAIEKNTTTTETKYKYLLQSTLLFCGTENEKKTTN